MTCSRTKRSESSIQPYIEVIHYDVHISRLSSSEAWSLICIIECIIGVKMIGYIGLEEVADRDRLLNDRMLPSNLNHRFISCGSTRPCLD
jgi:hypothetical protein